MSNNLRVLVTGATGFVGKPLVSLLVKEGYFVRVTNRLIEPGNIQIDTALTEKVYFDLDADNNDYDQLLEDIDIVIHLAARAHILHEKNNDDQVKYKKTNTSATETLVKESVKRSPLPNLEALALPT